MGAKKRGITPLGAIARGVVAGTVGTAAMDLIWFGRYRRGGGTSNLVDWEFSKGLDNWEAAPAPAQVGRRLVEGFLQRELKPDKAALTNNVTHWGYGVLWGALFGILAGSLRSAWVRYGAIFGPLVWASAYAVLSAAGLYSRCGSTTRRPLARTSPRISGTGWAPPFFVRAGKALAATALEAVVEFVSPPRLLFSPEGCEPHADHLRFRLGRGDGVTLGLQAEEPGEALISRPVELDVDFPEVLGSRQEAYERLLDDALKGNPARFAREDGVEAAWRVVAPVLDGRGGLHRYSRGSWGPAEANTLVAGHGGWHEPELPRG